MTTIFLHRVSALLSILLFCWPLLSQPYEIGRREATFIDFNRKDRLIKALILYPSDSAGCDVQVALPDQEGFPVVVFGHGYQMPVEPYRNIWESLVPEGFVVVLPRSGSGMFPSHQEFGHDMAFVLDEMIRLNRDSAAFFLGRLQPDGCLMGHSMGGGAAILGALQSRVARTLVLLAPLDTRPSSAMAARDLEIPTLIFAGSHDRITPPKKHQLPIYDSLQSAQKTFICIQGGNHCQMADSHRMCDITETTLYRDPGITREEQHRVLDRYILPWLRFYLSGDSAAGILFDRELIADPAISFQRKGNLSYRHW